MGESNKSFYIYTHESFTKKKDLWWYFGEKQRVAISDDDIQIVFHSLF